MEDLECQQRWVGQWNNWFSWRLIMLQTEFNSEIRLATMESLGSYNFIHFLRFSPLLWPNPLFLSPPLFAGLCECLLQTQEDKSISPSFFIIILNFVCLGGRKNSQEWFCVAMSQNQWLTCWGNLYRDFHSIWKPFIYKMNFDSNKDKRD